MENLAHLPQRNSSGYWIQKRYPNGEFTIGKRQPPRQDNGDHPLNGIGSHKTFYGATKVSVPARQPEIDCNPETLAKIAIAYEQAGDQDLANRYADRYASEILSGRHVVPNKDDLVVDGDDLAVPSLGLSDATNSHKSPPQKVKKTQKRGSGGISNYGKRAVRNFCYLLERDHTRNNLSFLTATLPAFMSRDELLLICKHWSELVRQFVQELRRILRRRGYCEDMVYITEIQEDRYRDRGEVAPHLHLVMVGKKHRWQKGYAIEKSEVRALWERLLSNFLGRPVTCAAATRVERPRKSLQAEFGSYLSKGGKIIKQIIDDGNGDFLPSAYWGGSRNLKIMFKKETKILTGLAAQRFVDNLQDLKGLDLVYFKPIMWFCAEIGREITIGFVGWIRDIGVVSEFLEAA